MEQEMQGTLEELFPPAKGWDVGMLSDGSIYVSRRVQGYIRPNPEFALTPDAIRYEAAGLRDDMAADLAGSVNA